MIPLFILPVSRPFLDARTPPQRVDSEYGWPHITGHCQRGLNFCNEGAVGALSATKCARTRLSPSQSLPSGPARIANRLRWRAMPSDAGAYPDLSFKQRELPVRLLIGGAELRILHPARFEVRDLRHGESRYFSERILSNAAVSSWLRQAGAAGPPRRRRITPKAATPPATSSTTGAAQSSAVCALNRGLSRMNSP